jgi:hypothetical protein
MPIGPKGQKRPADVIGNAIIIAKISTGEIKLWKTMAKIRPRRRSATRAGRQS